MSKHESSPNDNPESHKLEDDATLEERWNEPIIVYFPQDSGYENMTFTPDTPTDKLERLAFAYERQDPYARESLTKDDYNRLCAWLIAREIGWHMKSKTPNGNKTGKEPIASTTSRQPAEKSSTRQNEANKETGGKPPKTSSTATMDRPVVPDEISDRELIEHGNELLRMSGLDPNPKVGIAEEYVSFVVFIWAISAAVSGGIILLQTHGNVSETADLVFRMTLGPWLGQSTADLFPSRLPRDFETMAIILHGIPLVFLLVVPGIFLMDYLHKVWKLNRTIHMAQLKPEDLRGTLEKPHIIRSSYGLADCAAAVKSALDLSRKGKHRWTTLIHHPGQFIHAELQFEESFGATNALVLNRQILLSVYFTERTDGTDIQLDYEIVSPLSRYTCDLIVERMTRQLELALSN